MAAITHTSPSPGPGSSSTIGRVFEHRLMAYRRTFRSTIFTSFVTPALFLAAMGLGLGSYVDSGDSAALGGITYLAFLAPGLLAAASDELGVLRGGLSDHERARVEPDLPRDVRHADLPARRHAGQPAVHRGAPDADLHGLHPRHRALRGGHIGARRAGHPGRCPDRHGVRGSHRRVHARPRRPRSTSTRCSASSSRRCSCSPAPSSRSPRCL